MIRVMLVDDHPVVREGLAMMLATTDDIRVVCQTGDGADATRLVAEHTPDVVMLDLRMPGVSGLDVLGALAEAGSEVRVIVFSAYDDDEMIIEAVRRGVAGYILKGTPRAQLFESIRLVASGGSLVSPSLMARVLDGMKETAPSVSLTPRELEVLQLVAAGWTNPEIATSLGVAPRTVKFHVSSLLEKLQVDNRTEASMEAIRLGFVEL